MARVPDEMIVPSEGEILEATLLSEKSVYVQYLCQGRLGQCVRVLDGVYEKPLATEDLAELNLRLEAFVSQCPWKVLKRTPGVRSRGTYPIPIALQGPIVIRNAPPSETPRGDLYSIGDRRGIRGRDVLRERPDIDLRQAPLSSCPSVSLFLKRIELGWTPSVGHVRNWVSLKEKMT
jgi:hypothetical protein